MKKIILFFSLFAVAAPVAAEDRIPSELRAPAQEKPARKLFEEDSFSVSSDELDPSESLNRVAGEIDLGFSKPEQQFKSEEQPGPLSRQRTSTKY